MEYKPKSLNPKQITEAIEKGNIQNVNKGQFLPTSDVDEYEFDINGEHYHCYNGRVHVEYDFELSKSLLLKLHMLALQEGEQRQQERLKEIREKYAEVSKEYETINQQ